jgi:hypothetical protein
MMVSVVVLEIMLKVLYYKVLATARKSAKMWFILVSVMLEKSLWQCPRYNMYTFLKTDLMPDLYSIQHMYMIDGTMRYLASTAEKSL